MRYELPWSCAGFWKRHCKGAFTSRSRVGKMCADDRQEGRGAAVGMIVQFECRLQSDLELKHQ